MKRGVRGDQLAELRIRGVPLGVSMQPLSQLASIVLPQCGYIDYVF
jgi:hypothetical protein